jgi:hypothetical protein
MRTLTKSEDEGKSSTRGVVGMDGDIICPAVEPQVRAARRAETTETIGTAKGERR